MAPLEQEAQHAVALDQGHDVALVFGHVHMVEEVRDLADDFDEVRRTQGQPTLERVIEKPGDDQDTDDAGREARSDSSTIG